MLKFLIYFFIGLSLSMDAFSLALSIGTTSPTKQKQIALSSMVGCFHFFMPIIGSKIGNIFKYHLFEYANYITAFLLSILLIEMIIPKEDAEPIILNKITIIIIALTVSLDSLTVGIAFGISKEHIFFASTLFSAISFIFTYFGLLIGKNLKENYQEKARLFGIILMLLAILKYILLP